MPPLFPNSGAFNCTWIETVTCDWYCSHTNGRRNSTKRERERIVFFMFLIQRIKSKFRMKLASRNFYFTFACQFFWLILFTCDFKFVLPHNRKLSCVRMQSLGRFLCMGFFFARSPRVPVRFFPAHSVALFMTNRFIWSRNSVGNDGKNAWQPQTLVTFLSSLMSTHSAVLSSSPPAAHLCLLYFHHGVESLQPLGWIISVLSPSSSIALELIISNSHIPFNLGTGKTSLLHFIAGLCFQCFIFILPFVSWPENSHQSISCSQTLRGRRQYPSDVPILYCCRL